MTIEAGPDRKKYLLHKAFLTHYSEYFRNALKGPWKEAEEGVIPLEDIDLGVLNIFTNWLYTQEPPVGRDWCVVADIQDDMRSTAMTSLLMCKAVAFGDRFMAPKFYRDVNNRLAKRFHKQPPHYSTIIYAFENMPADRPLLKLLVDSHCRWWNLSMDEGAEQELQTQLPHEFLLRVMRTFGKDAKKTLKICDYHEHETGEEKARCMEQTENAARCESVELDLSSDSDSDTDSD